MNRQKLGLDETSEQRYLLVLNFAADPNLTLKRPHHSPATHAHIQTVAYSKCNSRCQVQNLNLDHTLLLPPEIDCSRMTHSHKWPHRHRSDLGLYSSDSPRLN